MAIGKIPCEKEFLLGLILGQFNAQYRKNLGVDNATIYSIRPAANSQLGYEVKTRVINDYVRMRAYFNLVDRTSVEPFRVEVNKSAVVGALGDEVYVTTGLIDRYYQDAGLYKFRWIEDVDVNRGFFADMRGVPIRLMNGGFFLTMRGGE